MPITTLNPLSVGSFSVWANAGGATKMASTTAPDDDDSSYVVLAGLSGTSRQSFNMDALPASAKGIQSHTVTARLRRATTGVLTLVDVFLAQSAGALITTGTAAQPALTYANRTELNLASPDGSLSWTPALINATEVGVHNSSVGANEEERCTTLSWAVTWQPNPGTMAVFVASLVGAVIGNYLSFDSVIKVAHHVRRITRGKHVITREDINTLFEEYRAPIRRYAI